MTATVKITQVDKYTPPVKIKVGNTVTERLTYFCLSGDTLEIITENAGAWCIVVICKNSAGRRYAVRWSDLENIQEDLVYDIEFELI